MLLASDQLVSLVVGLGLFADRERYEAVLNEAHRSWTHQELFKNCLGLPLPLWGHLLLLSLATWKEEAK